MSIHLSDGTWPFGKLLCHTYVYILHMIPNSSAGILVSNQFLLFSLIYFTQVLLSVERFIAVLRPMLVHHLMTRSVNLIWKLIIQYSSILGLDFVHFARLDFVSFDEYSIFDCRPIYGILQCRSKSTLWSEFC